MREYIKDPEMRNRIVVKIQLPLESFLFGDQVKLRI